MTAKHVYPSMAPCALRSMLAIGVLALIGDSTRADEIRVPKGLPTIQAAVDAASPGDTIKVRRGTYEEQIIIEKDVTLKGAGSGVTVIQAPPVMVPFAQHVLLDVPTNAIIEVTDGATVTMSDLTVTGPVPCTVATTGIAVIRNATLTITESHITRIRPEGPCAPENAFGRGIGIGLPPFVQLIGEVEGGSVGHATITELVIDKFI